MSNLSISQSFQKTCTADKSLFAKELRLTVILYNKVSIDLQSYLNLGHELGCCPSQNRVSNHPTFWLFLEGIGEAEWSGYVCNSIVTIIKSVIILPLNIILP